MSRISTLSTLAALALATPFASAQTSTPKSAVDDKLFASAAACGGMTEVMLAELGAKKATDPVLKKFSEQMIRDHSKMNSELKALAAEKQVALPTTVSDGSKFCYQNLAGLSGEEFDRCYAKAQLVLHMESLAMFEAESERGQDADMKALAAKGVPHIKEHFKEIKPIAMKYIMEMKEEKAEQKIDRALSK